MEAGCGEQGPGPGMRGDILKLDLNYYESLSTQYKVSSVPVLIIVKDNEVVDTIFRFESVTSIYEILSKSIDE